MDGMDGVDNGAGSVKEIESRRRLTMICINRLSAEVCQCMRQKQRGRSVCFKCFSMLPNELRRPLYCKIGAGYEEAYVNACRFLEESRIGFRALLPEMDA